MIVYPNNWKKIGAKITVADLEERIIEVLRDIYCNCLSLSGGMDSSLLLHYMCKIFHDVHVFTMGLSEEHPDVMFARKAIEYNKKIFRWTNVRPKFYFPTPDEIKDTGGKEGFLGDKTVQRFYKFVGRHTDKIIAGDTIDEYMGGYYAHMYNPTEYVYYDFIRQLQKNHLIPLNENSSKVKVYLPYADEKIIAMLSQIPLKDKIDKKNRKKFLIKMAKGKVPDEIIIRRKYGFCDALKIK